MSNKVKIVLVLVVLVALFGYLSIPSFFHADHAIPESAFVPQLPIKVARHSEEKKENNSRVADHLSLEKKPAIVMDEKPSQFEKVLIIPKLNIQLHAVFSGKKKNSGYAFISYNNAPQQVYIVGGRLSEGVFLKSLSTDEVVINNHGRLEKYPVKSVEEKSEHALKQAEQIALQSPKEGENDTPAMDSTPPPSPPPLTLPSGNLTPAQSREFIPPPPDGGVGPFGY